MVTGLGSAFHEAPAEKSYHSWHRFLVTLVLLLASDAILQGRSAETSCATLSEMAESLLVHIRLPKRQRLEGLGLHVWGPAAAVETKWEETAGTIWDSEGS
eukprot:g7385.t1